MDELAQNPTPNSLANPGDSLQGPGWEAPQELGQFSVAGEVRQGDASLDTSLMSPHERSLYRIARLREAARQIEEEIPEFAGMTLFGSTVRGQAIEENDVDLNVFFEPSEDSPIQSGSFAEPARRIRKTNPVDNPGNVRGAHVFYEDIDVNYQKAIKRILAAHGITIVEMDVWPINDEIVHDEVQDLLRFVEEAAKNGDTSSTWAPRNIRTLFNVPIAEEGLRAYQRQVVDELSASAFGAQAWKHISFWVRFFEGQGGRGGDVLNYPRLIHPHMPKFDEAKVMYSAGTSARSEEK
jgi:predicted nucleotidyltransferase